ncbi:hypothetical protein [Mangrovibacillus cuniculi]|uniref:Uncharacterized protein n=1 Tax=Mangrovibacillus cuniculi TaxID=2593652 RepID=A0A7S8HGR1_9BACI|nr:hypothetical protein [Mangrovibacillus cuniculi]QPC48158.1 hypothetical protein G8O30_15075 [Mangrovibacillus cuniculi]
MSKRKHPTLQYETTTNETLQLKSMKLSYAKSKEYIEVTLSNYLRTHVNGKIPSYYFDSNTMYALTEFYGLQIYAKGNQFGEYVASGNYDPKFEDSIEWEIEEILGELEEQAEEEFTREVVECFLLAAKSIFTLASEGAIDSYQK